MGASSVTRQSSGLKKVPRRILRSVDTRSIAHCQASAQDVSWAGGRGTHFEGVGQTDFKTLHQATFARTERDPGSSPKAKSAGSLSHLSQAITLTMPTPGDAPISRSAVGLRAEIKHHGRPLATAEPDRHPIVWPGGSPRAAQVPHIRRRRSSPVWPGAWRRGYAAASPPSCWPHQEG
jgi:hypothetical protein